ncbi:N-acetylglucosamine kinase [Leifsonia sp. AG29]|uniref:N-acetylglucosamine kinase n=1 Tax=Leifsonia sp. AG29 TaxID=2598860 RepID=UPI00131CE9F8|nr:BadF/BadG/BcrA/BcrD ATPase family protein [Leifsonia sp. AG29]
MTTNPICMGIDAGGSTLRIASGQRGAQLRVSRVAVPSNVTTLGPEPFSHAIADQIAAHVVDGRVPDSIAIGVAGLDPDTRDEVQLRLVRALSERRLKVTLSVHTDAEVAFAVAGAKQSGTVLIAGTGALASRIEEGREVGSVDGNGSALGDFGGGYWIGLEAARGALRDWELVGYRSQLMSSLISTFDIDPDRLRWSTIERFRSLSVSEIASFAQAVLVSAASNDGRSLDVVHRAADYLVESALAVSRGGEVSRRKLVLAGSLLTHENALSRRVRSLLASHFRAVMPAPEPVLGALEIAWSETR